MSSMSGIGGNATAPHATTGSSDASLVHGAIIAGSIGGFIFVVVVILWGCATFRRRSDMFPLAPISVRLTQLNRRPNFVQRTSLQLRNRGGVVDLEVAGEFDEDAREIQQMPISPPAAVHPPLVRYWDGHDIVAVRSGESINAPGVRGYMPPTNSPAAVNVLSAAHPVVIRQAPMYIAQVAEIAHVSPEEEAERCGFHPTGGMYSGVPVEDQRESYMRAIRSGAIPVPGSPYDRHANPASESVDTLPRYGTPPPKYEDKMVNMGTRRSSPSSSYLAT